MGRMQLALQAVSDTKHCACRKIFKKIIYVYKLNIRSINITVTYGCISIMHFSSPIQRNTLMNVPTYVASYIFLNYRKLLKKTDP